MTSTRRSFMWPTIIVTVGSIWLLMTAGAIPEAVGDILVRAWPALLIIFGLDVLVGRRRLRISRLTIDMNFLGLIITILVVVGVVWFAYQKQASVVRDDQVQTFSQTLSEDITKVQINVAVNRISVTALPASENGRDLKAEFNGSNESEVTIDWSVQADTAVLTITEKAPDTIPKLENYGRGSLHVTLPTEIPVEVFTLVTEQGDVDINMQPLRIDQLNLTTDQGDVTLNLPASTVLNGTLINRDGQIELTVPEGVALFLKLDQGSGSPSYRYDSFRYDVLLNGTLQRKNSAAFQVGLTITMKDNAPLIVNDLG